MTCGIYMIQNTINGKIYIGQSIDIELRFKSHKNKLERGNHIIYICKSRGENMGKKNLNLIFYANVKKKN